MGESRCFNLTFVDASCVRCVGEHPIDEEEQLPFLTRRLTL